MKTIIKRCILVLLGLLSIVYSSMSQDSGDKLLPPINIFNNSDYTIKGVAKGDFEIKFIMQKKNDSQAYEFVVYNLDLQTFINGFRKGLEEKTMDTVDKRVDQEASSIFYHFITGLRAVDINNESLKPKAGFLRIDSIATATIKIKKDKQLKFIVKQLMKSLKEGEVVNCESAYCCGDGDNDTKPKWSMLLDTNEKHTRRKYIYSPVYNGSEVYRLTRKETNSKLESLIVQCMDNIEQIKLDDIKKRYSTNEVSLRKNSDTLEKYADSIKSRNLKISDFKIEIEKYNKYYSSEWDKQFDYLSKNSWLENLLDGNMVEINNLLPNDTFRQKRCKFDYGTFLQENIDMLTDYKNDTTSLNEDIRTIDAKLKVCNDSLVLWYGQKGKKDNLNKANKKKKSLKLDRYWKEEQITNNENKIDELSWLKKNKDLISNIEANLKYYKWKIETIEKDRYDFEKAHKNYDNKKLDYQKIVTELNVIRDSLIQAYYERQLNLKKVQIEIGETQIELKGGYIENIKVKARFKIETLDGNNNSLQPYELTFENIMPIGFSREADYDVLKRKKTTLVALLPDGSNSYEVNVGDIIKYDYVHAVNRRDYSPENDLLNFDGNDNQNSSKVLYKDEAYKLFEIKVYSDFVGLNETAPNGLIQTEFEKDIPILTRRYGAIKAWRSNWGYLEQIVPKLVLSKLEEKNKYLPIRYHDSFNGIEYTPQKYVSTLELYQHESFSTGLDINLIVFDIINAKSTLKLDFGFRYGTTPVVDSSRTVNTENLVEKTNEFMKHNITTYRFFPRISLEIFPEERFNLKMSFTHNWYYAKTNLFEQVGNIDEYEMDPAKTQLFTHQFNIVELKAAINMQNTSKGKLFFRYTYNWQQNYWNTGFNQAQVGYSFYLMGRYKK